MVKVCFVLLLEQGHLAMCASIGKYLLARDPTNEVLFITDDEFEPAIKRQCSKFQTILFKQPEGVQERHKAKMNNKLDLWRMEHKESYKLMVKNFISMQELWQSRQFIVKDLVESIENLDFLFIENLFNLPFLQTGKVKWGMVISTNPLRVADQVNYPPMNSGTTDPKVANEFREVFKENAVDFLSSLDKWYEQFGLKRQPSLCYVEGSPYLNVYLYPRAFSYFKPEEIKPGKWFELQASVVSSAVEEKVKPFVDSPKLPGKELLTEEFLAKPGKLVLFSLGTIVTRTVEVFRQIVPLLKEIPHKFIVAKGKFGDQIELPANCVGANYLDQLELLKDERVDLFVTHGGNNSFTEAVYFGKPMIVIPAFGDQLDNAAKLEELNLGKRLHIGYLTKENIEEAMNWVLNNDDIRRRMKEIGEGIRNGSDGLEEICDLIYKEVGK